MVRADIIVVILFCLVDVAPVGFTLPVFPKSIILSGRD